MNRRQRLALALVLVTQVAFWAWLPTVVHSASRTPGDAANRTIVRAGIIRLGPGGPSLLEDSSHTSIGIERVYVKNGDLVIITDFDGSKERLVTALADEDFTLSGKRAECGVSGGGKTANIRCTKPDGKRAIVNSSYFDLRVDNIWFYSASLVR